MIDENLISHLVGLNTGAGDRVHEALLPQSTTYPAIAITVVQQQHERALGGEIIRSLARFRLDVYADTHSQVFPVSRALVEALDGFRGEIGSASPTQILNSAVTGPSDFSDEDGDRKLRHHILDLDIVYSEVL